MVCLDCGQQFAYDWNHMRVGKPIERSDESAVLHPDLPGPAKTKVKYALIGSVIPFALLAGRAMFHKRRPESATPDTRSAADANLDRRINLHGHEPGAGFLVRELVDYIQRSGRDYIIEGEIDCALADHPRPRSLDYWLRENFARNKETRQAARDVLAQLLATDYSKNRTSCDARIPAKGCWACD